VTTTEKLEKLQLEIDHYAEKIRQLEIQQRKLQTERTMQSKFGHKQKDTPEIEKQIKRILREKRELLSKKKKLAEKVEKIKEKTVENQPI